MNSKEPLDEELLNLLRFGDTAAFSKIYRRYWQNLYNAAYKRLNDGAYCEDIVQIIFSDLWRRREAVIIKDLPAYLHTAVRFQVLKYISVRPQPCLLIDELDVMLISPLRTDDGLVEREGLSLLNLWLDALPRKRREIFLMYIHEDLSTQEIAKRLDISRKTVQNQLNRVMTDLRARLTQLLVLMIMYLSVLEQ